MRHIMTGFALACILLGPPGAGSARAQHETAADLLDGERAYRDRCANCHGPSGDLVPGIDFGRGQFRRPMTDEELSRIIRQGIPNTPMPATNVSVEQAAQIVTYLRALGSGKGAVTITGDAARGKTLVEGSGNCLSCHRIGATGGRVGPDLSNTGATRRAAELVRALTDPQSEVQPTARFYRVVLADGTTVTGRLLGHDTFNVRLLDTKEQLRLFVKSDLKSHGFIPSPMPSYAKSMTSQQIMDVVSYLLSLKVPR